MEIIPLYTVKMCCANRFNKEADGPITGQDKGRQENQTKNAGREKGRVMEVRGETRKQDINMPC